jgi:hypothetical protein
MEKTHSHQKEMPTSGNQLTRGGPPRDNGPSFQESLREAESRAVEFPAAERAAYIRAMIKRVGDFKKEGKTTEQIQERLPEFAKEYPHLFVMLTKDEAYDASNLQTMLAMLDRMGQGNMNTHQASVIVGQRLANKYFHPTSGPGSGPATGQ